MAEQEQEMGRVNEELTDLRGNIGQITEMLQVIRAKMDTQPAIVFEIVNLVITPQPTVTTPATWYSLWFCASSSRTVHSTHSSINY